MDDLGTIGGLVFCLFLIVGLPVLLLAFFAWLGRYEAKTEAMRRKPTGERG